MSEFARGTLLGRHLFVTPEQSTLFTATVQTEVMAIYAPSDYTIGDPIISLFHEMPGTPLADMNTALIFQRQLSAYDDAVLLIAQCVGGGLHLQPGESIVGTLDAGSSVNMTLYGITATLLPVR